MPRRKKPKIAEPEARETQPVYDIHEEMADTGKDVEEIKEELTETGKEVEEIKEELTETGKDVEEIKEELTETGKDVDEIKEDVHEIREDVEEITKTHKSLLKKIQTEIIPSQFNANDVAQQIVGAIILSSPLAVTAEVWGLAQEIDAARLMVIIGITLLFDILLIYFTAYRHEKEVKIINLVPARLVSMLFISYLTAATMLYVFGVIGNHITDPAWALRLVIFIGLFANVGAGTADIIR
ncbi:MAG TPA: DUF2391 family protein [archaeon]|nr:DUF2391 family protein [archaeon]